MTQFHDIFITHLRACQAGTAAVEQLVNTKLGAALGNARTAVFSTCVARGSTQGHQHTQSEQQTQDQQQTTVKRKARREKRS